MRGLASCIKRHRAAWRNVAIGIHQLLFVTHLRAYIAWRLTNGMWLKWHERRHFVRCASGVVLKKAALARDYELQRWHRENEMHYSIRMPARRVVMRVGVVSHAVIGLKCRPAQCVVCRRRLRMKSISMYLRVAYRRHNRC